MPARVAIRSMLRSEYDAPSASSASVAASTAAWIAARLALGAGSSRDSTDAITIQTTPLVGGPEVLDTVSSFCSDPAIASLLDLTTQGHVATITAESKLAHVQL